MSSIWKFEKLALSLDHYFRGIQKVKFWKKCCKKAGCQQKGGGLTCNEDWPCIHDPKRKDYKTGRVATISGKFGENLSKLNEQERKVDKSLHLSWTDFSDYRTNTGYYKICSLLISLIVLENESHVSLSQFNDMFFLIIWYIQTWVLYSLVYIFWYLVICFFRCER